MRRTTVLCAVLLLAAVAGTRSAYAQQKQIETETIASKVDTISVDYISKYHSTLGSNWSIGARFGGNVIFAEEDGLLPFGQRIAPAWEVTLGREIIPDLALRFAFGMGSFYGWNTGSAGMYKWEARWSPKDPVQAYLEGRGEDCSKGYKEVIDYLHADFDVLFNIRNIINGHAPASRVLDLYAFLGAEFLQVLKANGYYNTSKIGLRAGGRADVNLTRRFALSAEISGTVMDATFDNQIGKGMSLNSYLAASLGVVVRLGRQGYVMERLVAPNQYVNLQEVITTVKEEYNEPIPVVEIVDVEATVTNTGTLFAPSIVFDEGAATYSEELQMVNLFKICKFMDQNPKLKLVVIGNTEGCDAKLARRRAELIRDQLVQRYGISPDRLKVSLQNVNEEYNVSGRSQTVNFGALL